MRKWDLYDENLNKTSIIINKGEIIPDGLYHLSSELWIINDKNEILLIKNSINYNRHYPGLWNYIWDYVLSGETSKQAMIRIVNSRIGIRIKEEDLEDLGIIKKKEYKYAYTTFIMRKNIDIESLLFIDGYSVTAKWVNISEFNQMVKNGEVPYFLSARLEKHIIPNI